MTTIGKKAAGRTRSYAAVRWLGTDKTDIISLCSIKNKDDRVVGREFMHRLHQKGTPQDTGPAMCKILKVSNKLDDLKILSVDSNGEMKRQGGEAPGAQQLVVEKKLTAQKKLGKQISSLAVKEAEQKLLHSSRLCETNSFAAAREASMETAGHEITVEEVDMDFLPSSMENVKEVVHAPMPPVTMETIIFMRQMLRCMEQAYEAQHGNLVKSTQVDVSIWKKNIPGSDPFHKGPFNKCFMFHQQKLEIENQSFNIDVHSGEKCKAWKSLVRQVLMEVYGSQIQNYCAKGRAGSRPGIDADIFRDLYWFAREFEGERTQLTEKNYITFINSLTWNHAKGEKENVTSGEISSAAAPTSQRVNEVDSPKPISRTQLGPNPTAHLISASNPPSVQPPAVTSGGMTSHVCNAAAANPIQYSSEGGYPFPQGNPHGYHQANSSAAWPITVVVNVLQGNENRSA